MRRIPVDIGFAERIYIAVVQRAEYRYVITLRAAAVPRRGNRGIAFVQRYRATAGQPGFLRSNQLPAGIPTNIGVG